MSSVGGTMAGNSASSTMSGNTTMATAAANNNPGTASGTTGSGKKVDPIPVSHIAMKLIDVRLKPSTAIMQSFIGEFTASGQQEMVFLRAGGTIELYRINTASSAPGVSSPGSLIRLVSSFPTRSVLRSCAMVRFTGDKRDVLAVGADGGALSIIDFEKGTPQVLHCQIFGKTGCRRGTPGQYVAADPKGRAVMIAAIEKRKLVYVLNRDAQGKPTIASPLEAHRTRTLTFATVGLDNGYDNPIFATLEYQYPEESSETVSNSNQKQLAYYELDLGLNHVSRKWACSVHQSAFCLAALPGGADGPGGVLVGGEDWIEYLHETMVPSKQTFTAKDRIVCAIPRRQLHPANKGILITQLVVHRLRKSKFFALAQSELGDIYKVMADVQDKTKVVGLSVTLLDTVPPANSLNLSKLGLLFVASEVGDHHLYRFLRIDLPDTSPSCASSQVQSAIANDATASTNVDHAFFTTARASQLAPNQFTPTTLKNMCKIYTMDSAAPTTGVLVGELAGNEVSPQIYTLHGSASRSSLRILRHGAAVRELAVSDLPGVPGGIFTIADNNEDQMNDDDGGNSNDRFIVVSFADATLVLRVGDTVEEVGKESGLETSAPTLACTALGTDGGMVQVHPAGVRHIQKGKAKQWHCPGLKRIECASANESQVIIALAGGEVIFFELDHISGNLTESATRDMGADVCCLDVGTIPKGRGRSLFAAVGCRDQTVRIVSLEKGKHLMQQSSTALKSRPHSVALQIMSVGRADANEGVAQRDDTVLTIGLNDGSSLRASVDPVTGAIGTSPTRRFLGARPVSVSRVNLESNAATLLLSSRPWISRMDPTSGKHVMSPLSYTPLDHGCSFKTQAIQEGIVATAGKTLRILSVDTAGMEGGEDEAFNINKVALRYTPRQMTLLATTAAAQNRKVVLAIVEADHNEYGFEEKKSMGFDFTGKGMKKDADGMDMDDSDDDEVEKKAKDDEDGDDNEEEDDRTTTIRGPYPSGPGHWGSCIRLVDPADNCSSLECVELNRNEAALCCNSVRFHSRGGEPLLAVGTVTGMTLHPLKIQESHVALYRIVNGERLQLVHRTKVSDTDPVLALAHFQGRLLVGIGNTLRLYEMGKRQLLRKCELKGLPTIVKTLQTAGDRAFVGDMLRSIQIVRHDASSNRLVLVAMDPFPRPITCQELLDWNTIAVGDKFGNVTILRVPRGADAAAVDLTGQRALWETTSQTTKMEILCQYYVGEVITSMTRASLVAGGSESLIYATITGRVGALVPFTSRDDVEFYTQLEGSLRKELPRPTGRDPQSYRSFYAPVKHVVDGDLCGCFNSMSHTDQSKVADKIDRTVGEVLKKLEDTRNSLL